jgi:hypothetical protein
MDHINREVTTRHFGFFTEVRFAAPLGNLRSSENDEGQINANPGINDALAQAMPVSHFRAKRHSHGATELGFCAVDEPPWLYYALGCRDSV